VLLTLLLDVFDVGMQLFLGLPADSDMAPRMVADFKSVVMELLDLLPGHVVLLVLGEIESFGDEKGGAESMFLEERSDEGCVAGDRIVEGQNDSTRSLFLRHAGTDCGHKGCKKAKYAGNKLLIEIHGR